MLRLLSPHTITQKVTLIGIIIGGILLVVIGLLIQSTISVNTTADFISQTTIEQVKLSGQFNTDMFRGFTEALTFARTHLDENRQSALQEMKDAGDLMAQLAVLEKRPDPFDTKLTSQHIQLQQRREDIYNRLDPALQQLIQAVESNNQLEINRALTTLNLCKGDIEQLEEDAAELADRSTSAATAVLTSRSHQSLTSASIVLGLVVIIIPLLTLLMRYRVAAPLNSLAKATMAIAAGQRDLRLKVTSHDELGLLQRSFNQMIERLSRAQAAVVAEQQALEERVAERTAKLQETLAELQSSMAEREQLVEAIRTISSPVLPVRDDILVMPLIGLIDSERADVLVKSMLDAIEQYHARTLIIDMTGIPVVDTHVAQTLLQATQACRLLGASVMLVGLRPELAQTIVGLGINLEDIEIQSNLQKGIEHAMRLHNHTIRSGYAHA